MTRRPGLSLLASSLVILFIVFPFTSQLSLAQTAQQAPPMIQWENGPTVGRLGDVAEIRVPQGYRFTGQPGAIKLLELTQNPSSGRELGALIPANTEKDSDAWFVIFEFSDTG
ncbi:MAG: DUF2167 domain-containing protein, partial [Acidobacteria bacterium]|nr:DUF2167 domain-containing protein [Acidobacteriota bacterium]